MVKQIPNYIPNKILKAIDLINQWKSQSEDTILGYVGATRLPKAEFNIGDLTAIVNGSLANDFLIRTGGSLKEYNSSGALQNSQTIAQILRASLALNSNFIEGFVCGKNFAQEILAGVGKCLSKGKDTILELTSPRGADLNNHITPAINTTYHLYIYKHSGTGVILVDFSTSLTPTAGTGAGQLPDLDGTKYRRIASFKTDGSANFRNYKSSFENGALRIEYTDSILDTNVTLGVGISNPALSIPIGIELLPIVRSSVSLASPGASTLQFAIVSALATTASRPHVIKEQSATPQTIQYSWTTLAFKTITGALRIYIIVATGSALVYIETFGYIDYRINN